MVPRYLLALALLAAGASAQALRVYSELQRIDPFGAVVAMDRAERPREILSPALARNAYATFQAVVNVPSGSLYSLYVVQNPEDAVRVTAYLPTFVKLGQTWIPDGLDALKLSDARQVLSPTRQVPGQTVTVVWLDLWVAADAPVRRTRLEVQLFVGDQWIVYPMELRIVAPVVPPAQGPLEALSPIEASAARAAAGPLRAYLCAAGRGGEEGPLTVRGLIRRNARQDVALARSLGRATLPAEILETLGVANREKWCQAPGGPPQLGAEWVLRVRDYLYRTAAKPLP